MRERSAEHPNGVDRGPRRVFAKGLRNVALRHIDESIVTSIPGRFTGGRIESTDNRFNGRLVWEPQAAQNTDNSS